MPYCHITVDSLSKSFQSCSIHFILFWHVDSISKVTVYQAWLVLGWVTFPERQTTSVCDQPPSSTRRPTLHGTSRSVVLCGWGVKAGGLWDPVNTCHAEQVGGELDSVQGAIQMSSCLLFS